MNRVVGLAILSMGVLVFSPRAAWAGGPKNCHYRLAGWLPSGTGYVAHMECVGEDLSDANQWVIGDENATPTKLCSFDTCPTLAKAMEHPKVKALDLVASGPAPAGLKAKATVRKAGGWALTFTLTKGRKTFQLGKKTVGGTRWKLKKVLWEPKGRAVAFTFDNEEGKGDKGESVYVFAVPPAAR